MTVGPVAPPAVVRLVVFLLCPVLVSLSHGLVDRHAGLVQALQQAYMVGGAHVAAAAVAHVEPVELAAAEDGHLGPFCKRQGPVIFQQHAALRPCLSDQRPNAGGHVPFPAGGGLLLHQAVSHGGVNDPLHQLPGLLLPFFHRFLSLKLPVFVALRKLPTLVVFMRTPLLSQASAMVFACRSDSIGRRSLPPARGYALSAHAPLRQRAPCGIFYGYHSRGSPNCLAKL